MALIILYTYRNPISHQRNRLLNIHVFYERLLGLKRENIYQCYCQYYHNKTMPSRSIFSHVFFFILKWMSLILCFSFIVSYVYQEPLKTLKSIVNIPLGYDRFSVIFSEKFFSSRNDNNVTKPFVPGQH